MTSQKSLIAGVAILAAGAVAGWSASRSIDTPATASTGTPVVAVQEPVNGSITPQKPYSPVRPARRTNTVSRGIRLPAGTSVHVTVDEALSSKTAQAGQAWSGIVSETVYQGDRVVIPAGSRVRGTVALSDPAERGDRAKLQLAMSSVVVNGRTQTVRGSSQTIVAGSPRTRNVGAIAGATAAGALIGRAVGGSTKSTVIGAAVGGGAATAVVAASKGYQATIPAGQDVAFTITSSATVRA